MPVLQKGSSGPAVTGLQQKLAALGFPPGVIDGQFGIQTQNAVKAFQRSRGLSADGIVGGATWAAISTAPTTKSAAGPGVPVAEQTAGAPGTQTENEAVAAAFVQAAPGLMAAAGPLFAMAIQTAAQTMATAPALAASALSVLEQIPFMPEPVRMQIRAMVAQAKTASAPPPGAQVPGGKAFKPKGILPWWGWLGVAGGVAVVGGVVYRGRKKR